MKTLLLVIVVLFSVEASAQTPALDVSHAALYFTTGADLGTTWYGILKDKRREANPLLNFKIADVRKRTFVQASAVTGVTIAADISTHRVARAGHPKLAAALRLVIAGSHTYAVIRNLK